MKKLYRLLMGTCAILAYFLSASPTLAAAGINRQINFQGKVVNKDGSNVSDNNYNFTFSLYTTASGGSPIWTETWNSGTTQVSVTSGIFNVNLGAYSTFPPTVDFNSDSLYLGINFNADGEMTPRIRMTAVPYALNAEKVGGLTVTNTTGTLTIPNGKTIQFGDSFVTSGVGISLDQSLATTNSVSFAGLSIGGTAIASTANELNYLHNLAAGNTGALVYLSGVGMTQLNIGASGYVLMSDGTKPIWAISPSGSNYSFTNGLSLSGTTVGLGGTITQSTTINMSGFNNLSFLGGNNVSSLFLTYDGRVGIGTTTNPREKLNVIGNLEMDDTQVSPTKSYRLRTTGGSLDFEAAGAQMYLSTWSNADYTGTQRYYLVMENGANNAQALNTWQWRTGANATTRHTIDGSTGASVAFNQDLENTNFSIGGSGNGGLFFVNGTTNRVGIGTTNPMFALDIKGDLNLTGTIFAAGTSGAPGQVLSATAGGLQWTTAGAGSTNVFTNGLSILTGSNVGLGGTLTQNTNIGMSSFNLNFMGIGGTQSLFVSSSGAVGIGTTNPTSHLQVYNNGGSIVRVVGGADNTSSSLELYEDYDVSPGAYGFAMKYNGGYNRLEFNSYNGSTPQTNMVINRASGYVGIGTTNPLYNLDVSGNLNLSGTVFAAGTSGASGQVLGATAGGLQWITPGGATYYANNGLTMSGTAVGLGGTLTQNTNIGTSSFALSIGATGGNLGLIVDSTGNVGIGNTGTAMLDIGGTSTRDSAFKVDATLNTIAGHNPVAFVFVPVLHPPSGNSAASFYVAPTIQVDAGTTSPYYRGIHMDTPSKIGSGTLTSNYLLYLSSPGTIANQNFAIYSVSGTNYFGGSVGIGTTAPKYSLEVGNDALIGTRLGIGSTNTLYTLNAGGTASFANLLTTGYVGIGTTNSQYQLQVAGDSYINNNLGVGLSMGIGTGGNMITMNPSGGITMTGTARPSKKIVLSPEYAGASISRDDGTNNNGSMTSDNILNTGAGGWKNYYEWTSTQAIIQDYSVLVRVTLPNDFDSWETGSCPGSTCAMEVNYQTGVGTTDVNYVAVRVNSDTDTPGTAICTLAGAGSTTWTSYGCPSSTLTSGSSPQWGTAGSTSIIRIKLAANNTGSAAARVGDIVLRYKAKY
ncbi:MAG TPA: hypothetical protein VF828_02340 [Patescibacteria group bacterium]